MYNAFYKSFYACAVITAVWVVLIALYKLFGNFDKVWDLKWVLDVLSESIPLIVFTSSVVLFTPKSPPMRDGYVHHLEESNDNYVNKSKDVEMAS
jgi:hypothetical protein